MNCPKCDTPIAVNNNTFWLPQHIPANNPPISQTEGLPVRVYRCEECEYVILKLA